MAAGNLGELVAGERGFGNIGREQPWGERGKCALELLDSVFLRENFVHGKEAGKCRLVAKGISAKKPRERSIQRVSANGESRHYTTL